MRVNILLSTYNGELYLRQQLDSILAQTYTGFTLYIRDDGSQDGTPCILEEYRVKDDRIRVLQGENTGFVKSFFSLLKLSEEGDLWSFCDQDDVWRSDKLERAVTWFHKNNDVSVPMIFHCGYEVTDEALHITGSSQAPPYDVDFRRVITENYIPGFTMVINNAMREYALRGDPVCIDYHDWWIALIGKAFGKVYYDNQKTVLYRRLDSSVSRETSEKKWKWLKRQICEESAIDRRMREFQRCFSEQLPEREREYVRWFAHERYNFLYVMKKVCFTQRWREKWSSEIIMRLCMIFDVI